MMFYKNTTALSWAFLLIVFFSMGINCINAQNLDEIKIRTENSSLTIEQFFNYIEQNTPFKFSYNSESILLKKKIQLSNREESLYKILLWLGKLNEMTFQRIGNQIVVKKANKNETNFVADEISDDEKKEDNGFLRCLVTDSLSGEPLPFANVIIKELNRGGISNSKGYLIISGLRPQNVNVEISYIGFAKKNIQINIKRNVVTNLVAQLVSKNIQMGLIETKSVGIASESLTNLGLKTFSLKDIDRLPKGLELDVFKSLQNIAGVQSSGDASSRFFVRGSSSNENLILLDNTVLYNPFHAFGLLSAIDPDMINSVEFYKGGFPVDYTDRLSSVIRVNTKNGNNSNYSGKASLSLLTAKFLAEGPIPYGSFIITGRKNYSNWILEKYRNDDAMPADFYDLFAKIKYTNNNFLKDASFTLSTFVSNDKVVYQNPNLEDFKWNNKSIALNYFQVSDSPLFFQIDLSHSYFKGERLPNYTSGKSIINEVLDISMLVDFNYTYQSKNVLSGGLRIKHIETNLEITNFLGTSSLENREGASISAFLKYNLLQFQNFGLELGSRLHGTRLAGGGVAINYEPRISLSYWLLPQLAIKSSYGHFIQDLVTVSDENEVITVFEPWIITPLYLKPSNAIHYNIGLEILANQNLSIELEGYYKDLKNLAVLNENKITVDAHDFIQASGESYGAELTCQYNLHPFLFTCAYSLMKSQRTADGKTYSPRYDSRNNLSLSSEVDLGYGWNASVLWKYNSGTPFTQITGYYEKLTPELIGDRAFILDSYSYFTKLGEKNLGRLPDYHRLDFNIKKKFIFTSFSATIDFSIQNVYNRANIFYFKRDTGERVNMIPFLPSISVKVEL